MRILIIALLLPLIAYTQDEPKVSWGAEIPVPKKTEVEQVLSTDASGFWVLGLQRKGFADNALMEKYEPSMDLASSSIIELPEVQKDDLVYERIVFLRSNAFLFASRFEKDAMKTYLYVSALDDRGNLMGQMIPIDSVRSADRKTHGSFDVFVTPDKNRMMIYKDEPFSPGLAEEFSYRLLDANLNTLWSRKMDLPYSDENFMAKEYVVDDSGNVYMLGRITETGNIGRGSPKTRYAIIAWFPQEEKTKQYNINIGGFVADVTFKLNKDNRLVCAGFYSNRTGNQLVGSFYVRIDPETQKVLSSGSKNFEKRIYLDYTGQGSTKKKPELYSLNLKHLMLRDDGGVMLVAEQYYEKVVTTNDPNTGASRSVRYYYYNDIIVASMAADSIQWTSIIPKKQVTTGNESQYLSFGVGQVRDKIYLVYYDNPSNLVAMDRRDIKEMRKAKNAMATLVAVYGDGSYDKTPLFPAGDPDHILRPSLTKQIGDHDLLIYGTDRKTYRFGKVTLH